MQGGAISCRKRAGIGAAQLHNSARTAGPRSLRGSPREDAERTRGRVGRFRSEIGRARARDGMGRGWGCADNRAGCWGVLGIVVV
ncbi:MAG: hypothetical protein OXI72_09230, partial [Gemmatimonadota bacterium]|nr:hypothetical protein [Gemmatimonadota bacterium]